MLKQPSLQHCSQAHYGDVMMGAIGSQITSLTSVYSTVYSGVDQRKHQSSASLAFMWGIHRRPHKWPVTRKMFPFDDVIMIMWNLRYQNNIRTRVFFALYVGPLFVNPSWLWFQIPRLKSPDTKIIVPHATWVGRHVKGRTNTLLNVGRAGFSEMNHL